MCCPVSDSPASPIDRLRQCVAAGCFEAGLACCDAALTEAGAMFLADGRASPQRQEVEALFITCLLRTERFEPAVAHMQPLLTSLAHAQPSPLRAEMLVRLAFALMQLSRYEAAMRAAHLALHDALALDDRPQAAQALERIAMSAMSLGDPLMAERFTLEALGFYEQCRTPEDQLRGSSNAMFVYCNLHDHWRDAGQREIAASALLRCRPIIVRSAALAESARDTYLGCMWRANEARWLRRRGQVAEADAQMRDVHAQALAHGWHAVRRPIALELAQRCEAEGQLAEAAALLAGIFEPADAPPRDRIANLALARLPELCDEIGDRAAAERHRAQRNQLRERIAQEAERAQQHLNDLADLAATMLAEADRKRLEDELARLHARPMTDVAAAAG
jgi:hypothetical protein